MTQELVETGGQSIALSPDDVVQNASHQSKLLMKIVDQTKCYQVISGKKYLQVEAWETIGAFNRVHAVTEWTHPVERESRVVGYDAKVNLVNADGIVVGSAIMPCYFTENACKGKIGDAKDKASKSAAQTFATSKAYRMNYSYVAILAGYQPTPAEEMTGDAPDERPANLEHWCEKHKTKWFKRGKMQSYAHPIGDTGEWCHEHKAEPKPASKPAVQPEPESPPDTLQSPTEVIEEQGENIHQTKDPIGLQWLKESLKSIPWTAVACVQWLRGQASFQGFDFSGKIEDIVRRMDKNQSNFLEREVQERLKMR